MKIIDAHLHFATDAYFDEIAKAAEHENSADHLLEQYRMRGMVHGIVMGNLPVEELEPVYPPFLSYCIGLDSQVFDMAKLPQKLHLIEQHLRSERCVGIKLYPGYASLFFTITRLFHHAMRCASRCISRRFVIAAIFTAWLNVRAVQRCLCHFNSPFLGFLSL